MPIRRVRKTTARKPFKRTRRFVRRGRKTTRKSRVRRSLPYGFPSRMFTRLKYVQNLKLALPSAGSVVQYTYKSNSLYDPDPSIGGHQPMYTDQICATTKYTNYNVFHSSIKVKFLGFDQQGGQFVMSVFPTEKSVVTVNSSAFSDQYATMLEFNGDRRFGKMSTVSSGIFNNGSGQAIPQKGRQISSAFYDGPKWSKSSLGAYLAVAANSGGISTTAASSDPPDLRYFQILVGTPTYTGTAPLGNVYFNVEIDLKVMFYGGSEEILGS